MSSISINHYSKTIRLYADGKQHYFSFKKYSGFDNALAAALIAESELPENIRWQSRYYKNGYGESGIVGVGKKMLRGDHVGWVAYYQSGPEGRRRQVRKCFSFNQYGRHALGCAAQWRAVMIGYDRYRFPHINQ